MTLPMPWDNDIVPHTAIHPKKHDQRTSQAKVCRTNGIGPSRISNETIINAPPVIRSRIPFDLFNSAVSRAVRRFLVPADLSIGTSLPSRARATTSRAIPQARQNRASSRFCVAHFGQYTHHLSLSVCPAWISSYFGNASIERKVPVRK